MGSGDLIDPLRRKPPGRSGTAELKASAPTTEGKQNKTKKHSSLFQSGWEDKSASLLFFEVGGKICLLLLLYPVRLMHFLWVWGELV